MHTPLPTKLPAAQSNQSPNLLNPPSSKRYRRWKERKYERVFGEQSQCDALVPVLPLFMEGATTVFKLPCPGCNHLSDLNFEMNCQHRSTKNGRVCGWRIPTTLAEMNGDMRGFIRKHTTQPTGQFRDIISYNTSTGDYLENRLTVAMSGSVFFDWHHKTFCLYATPSGTQGIGTACSGSAEFSFPVSGIKMFTNSKAQDMHHHYSNFDESMQFICAPGNVVIESRNKDHPLEYIVFKEGKKLAVWNSELRSLYTY